MLPFSVEAHPASPAARQTTPQHQIQRVLKAQTSVMQTVQRTLVSTTELDQRFNAAQGRADESGLGYLQADWDETNDAERADRLRQVRGEQRTAMVIAEKKVQLLSEAHDLIDRQIDRLDTALGQLQEEYGPLAGLGAPLNGPLSPGVPFGVHSTYSSGGGGGGGGAPSLPSGLAGATCAAQRRRQGQGALTVVPTRRHPRRPRAPLAAR